MLSLASGPPSALLRLEGGTVILQVCSMSTRQSEWAAVQAVGLLVQDRGMQQRCHESCALDNG